MPLVMLNNLLLCEGNMMCSWSQECLESYKNDIEKGRVNEMLLVTLE